MSQMLLELTAREELPMASVILTAKEREVFLAIFEDEYSDGSLEARPWSWSVVGGSKSRAGSLSSLTQKGLVRCEGTGRDASCYYTEEGKRLFREINPLPIGCRVTPSGEGRTERWNIMFGVVTQRLTDHSVEVRWEGTSFGDEMELAELTRVEA
jgi:hypothetical protein